MVVSGYLDPPASIQHVLHRLRREPATSDRRSVGLRDRQARVLLLLLRRGVARDSGRDASSVAPVSVERCWRSATTKTNAAAYTVSPTRAKLIAFALSGGVAAFAGGLFAAGHATQLPDYFTPEESLRVLAVSVVGGLSSVTGAVLGTIVIIGIPTVFEGSQRAPAASRAASACWSCCSTARVG